MRIAAVSLLVTILVGSGGGQTNAQPVDRIELRQSGWASLDIEVNRQGESRYDDFDPDRGHRRGTFTLSARQYEDLVARLAVYRHEAVPMNDDSMRALMRQTCPPGVDFTTDSGGIWVHWISPGTDRHYFVDLGCDRERNARRNADLRSILHSLPVPKDL